VKGPATRPSGAGTRRPRKRSGEIGLRLARLYPGSASELCALRFESPFQLLVATVLSAQCTDERVNMVVPALFARYPGPAEMAAADRNELEDLIRSTGFFRAKANHLLGASQALLDRHGGTVPRTMEELTDLPGVGRKTANVVLSVAFFLPGLPVDTHVGRLAGRLGLSGATDPVRIETDLCELYPKDQWGALSLRLIQHGRRVCAARRPLCGSCELADLCPSRGVAGRR